MAAIQRPNSLTMSCVARRVIWILLLVGILSNASAAESPGGLIETPLTERSGPRGATLFSELAPQQTGIVTENRYADPRMWGDLYREFEVGAVGTGVAIADYDGDG